MINTEYDDKQSAAIGAVAEAMGMDFQCVERDVAALTFLQYDCHALVRKSGWWDEHDAAPSALRKHFIAGKMALIHSEVSEALEGFRKNAMDDHLPHRPAVEVEFADAIIRILDLAEQLELDVGGALIEKLAYNQTREDHKPENRAAKGGKSL